jgi:hypothetical protein
MKPSARRRARPIRGPPSAVARTLPARASPLPQPVFDEPVFTEGPPTPDPTGFHVPHPSDAAQYQRLQALLYEEVVGFPAARGKPADLYALADALGPHGPKQVAAIEAAGRIVFHAVGDIGASTATKYPDEIRVSDRITEECATAPANARPAFLYLLGDVVYDFGEPQYYYDQFYEPYRDYPAPIFAIPGNHDSFVVPGTAPTETPLEVFQRNFCAAAPVVTPEAASLHRTAMTEPGVYFALEAPFVRIIGLFSNALEDPGVVSSEGGKWAAVPDLQLAFLAAQLARVTSEGLTGALLLAVHHPPFTYAPPPSAAGGRGTHGGSPAMLADVDAACQRAGIYPDAILSGHAHNYQRFSRTVTLDGAERSVPFVVCGDGGHNVDPLLQARGGARATPPPNGTDVSYLDAGFAGTPGRLILERYDDRHYGYLRVSASASELTIAYFPVGAGIPSDAAADSLTVALRPRPATGTGQPSTHRSRA